MEAGQIRTPLPGRQIQAGQAEGLWGDKDWFPHEQSESPHGVVVKRFGERTDLVRVPALLPATRQKNLRQVTQP